MAAFSAAVRESRFLKIGDEMANLPRLVWNLSHSACWTRLKPRKRARREGNYRTVPLQDCATQSLGATKEQTKGLSLCHVPLS